MDLEESGSEDFRKRMIENNFELMNGSTIVVVTSLMKIPKHFLPLNNLQAIREAVSEEMEGA